MSSSSHKTVPPPPALVELLPRGVAIAPWVGSNGEVVLVAVDSHGRKFSEVSVPPGENRLCVEDALQASLDANDPPSGPALVA